MHSHINDLKMMNTILILDKIEKNK